MSTVLCLDDSTFSLSEVIEELNVSGYRVLAADDSRAALELCAENSVDAVVLNCHDNADNWGLITALRMIQPRLAVIMLSAYCGVPCHQLQLADACLQKGETGRNLLSVLSSVLCQRKYGLCRWVAA